MQWKFCAQWIIAILCNRIIALHKKYPSLRKLHSQMKFFEFIGVIFQPRYMFQILEWTVEFTDYNTASFIRNPPLPLSMTGKITILKGPIISKKNTIFWVLLLTSLVIRHFEILQKVAVIQIPFFTTSWLLLPWSVI